MKIRSTFSISPEAIERLEFLVKNSHKIYGKNCNKSIIIETLIMNTKDRLAIIKEKKRELAKEMTVLSLEEDAIEEIREK